MTSVATSPTLEIPRDGVVRGACPHDCPDTCATLVTVENGRAVRIAGDPDHPFTQGFLCAKVNRYVERTYHADRLTTPLRRVGPKGEGRFEPHHVGRGARRDRDAAHGDIARSADGPQAILPYSYAGTMGMVQGESMDRRFFHLLGASKLDRTICSMAGTVGMRMTVGANIGADSEGVPESDLVLLWGTNTLTANPHLWPFVLKAKERGAPIICIDPIRTRTADAVRRVDRDPSRHRRRAGAGHDARAVRARHCRIATSSSGTRSAHEELRARAAEWTPARTAAITGLSGGDDRLARRAVRAREGGVHPRELRAAAPRRRRDGGAHHRLPAGGHRPLAPRRRRRAALDDRQLPVRPRRDLASGPRARPCARST